MYSVDSRNCECDNLQITQNENIFVKIVAIFNFSRLCEPLVRMTYDFVYAPDQEMKRC